MAEILVNTRYLECKTNGSHKFYEVAVYQNTGPGGVPYWIVKGFYGKINKWNGTGSGNLGCQSPGFTTEGLANTHALKLMNAKTKKGYQIVRSELGNVQATKSAEPKVKVPAHLRRFSELLD